MMLRRILAAATLLVLVIAPPLVLLRVGFTDVGAITVWTVSDVRILLLLLTALAWAAWAWWALAVAIEAASLVGRRPRLRLPALSLPRALAATLLAAAFASAALAAHAAPAPVPAVVQAARVPEQPVATPEAAGSLVHRVRPGDDLWSLAAHYYGDGTQWRQIVSANPALADDPLAPLVVGETLVIADPVRLVTVQRGDTLSGLALRHLGDAHRWPEIHALNASRIQDPDLIDIGWTLRLPWVIAAGTGAPAPRGDERPQAKDAGVADSPRGETSVGDQRQPPQEAAAASPGTPAQGTDAAREEREAPHGRPAEVPRVAVPGAVSSKPATAGRPAQSEAHGEPAPGEAGTPAAKVVVPAPADPEAERDQRASGDADVPAAEVDAPERGTPDGPVEATPAPGDGSTPAAEVHAPDPGAHPAGTASTPAPGDAGNPAADVHAPDVGASADPVHATPAASDLLIAGVTSLAAAAIVGGIGLQRRLQRHSRPVGRRFVQPGEDLSRYESALQQAGAGAAALAGERTTPGRDELLARAQRLLADAWRRPGQRAVPLARAIVDDQGVAFAFAEPPSGAPVGFTRIGDAVAISWEQLAASPDVDGPAAFPALVTLGRDASGAHVMLDAMESGVLGVACRAEQGRREVLSAILIELACAPWADELDLLVVTSDPDFARATAASRIVTEADAAAALARIETLAGARAEGADGRSWRDRRLDPDLTDAWAPVIVLWEQPLGADDLGRLRAVLDGRGDGLAAIVGVDAPAGTADWTLTWSPPAPAIGAPPPHPLVEAGGISATPQAVSDDTRAAVTGLFALATTTSTEPAPWWPEEEADMDIVAIEPAPDGAQQRAEARWSRPGSSQGDALAGERIGPRLHLLGPVDLTGCAGDPPSRAQRQCVEYCAWLHLHPGASPQQMGRSLLVAEGTRRSNMSRLRTWLGYSDAGELYLPDAYSGRIWLSEDVTSDWGDLLLLTSGGLNAMPLDRLLAALRLVRGAPLADAAPGQWGWAEELRADAGALIRDIGVVAARRALEDGDMDTARWAAGRALVAAPDDELLMVERIRTEHRAGRPDDARRLVQRVTRTARTLGLDLLPETVDVCQQVVEGRLRARN